MGDAVSAGGRSTKAGSERWVDSESMGGLLKYSEDGKKVMAHGRVYELDDNASLSFIGCPDSIAETMGWVRSDP